MTYQFDTLRPGIYGARNSFLERVQRQREEEMAARPVVAEKPSPARLEGAKHRWQRKREQQREWVAYLRQTLAGGGTFAGAAKRLEITERTLRRAVEKVEAEGE